MQPEPDRSYQEVQRHPDKRQDKRQAHHMGVQVSQQEAEEWKQEGMKLLDWARWRAEIADSKDCIMEFEKRRSSFFKVLKQQDELFCYAFCYYYSLKHPEY